MSAAAARKAAVSKALSKLGTPYRWGAMGPNAFDCSGLVKWSFAQAGQVAAAYLPCNRRRRAPRSRRPNLQPGDLVFFYKPISHVGIYIGNGKIVHASRKGQPVKVSDMGRMKFTKAVSSLTSACAPARAGSSRGAPVNAGGSTGGPMNGRPVVVVRARAPASDAPSRGRSASAGRAVALIARGDDGLAGAAAEVERGRRPGAGAADRRRRPRAGRRRGASASRPSRADRHLGEQRLHARCSRRSTEITPRSSGGSPR